MERPESPIEAEVRERLRRDAPRAADRLSVEQRASLHRALARRGEARGPLAPFVRPALAGAVLLAAAALHQGFLSTGHAPPRPATAEPAEPAEWPTARSIDARLERLKVSLADRREPAAAIVPLPSFGSEISRLRDRADQLRKHINQG